MPLNAPVQSEDGELWMRLDHGRTWVEVNRHNYTALMPEMDKEFVAKQQALMAYPASFSTELRDDFVRRTVLTHFKEGAGAPAVGGLTEALGGAAVPADPPNRFVDRTKKTQYFNLDPPTKHFL